MINAANVANEPLRCKIEKALAFPLVRVLFFHMATPQPVKPVKLVIALLFVDAQRLQLAVQEMTTAFGPIDYISPHFAFEATNYYFNEMGAPIARVFYSFAQLVSPEELAAIKLRTNEIEHTLAADGKRTVNLDPGYLDTDKFVLASAKYHGYKIYLRDGIWADMTLHYEKGRFTALPWSFPDFKSGAYEKVFLRVREIYKKQLQALQ